MRGWRSEESVSERSEVSEGLGRSEVSCRGRREVPIGDVDDFRGKAAPGEPGPAILG